MSPVRSRWLDSTATWETADDPWGLQWPFSCPLLPLTFLR